MIRKSVLNILILASLLDSIFCPNAAAFRPAHSLSSSRHDHARIGQHLLVQKKITNCRATPSITNEERQRGLLVLATVPFAWGSYEVALRYVYYATDPPIPGFLFGLAFYSIAASTLSFLALAFSTGEDGSSKERDEWPLRAGFELGSYLFFGNALQALALKTIAADRAAFLLQLTTIFVPLVSAALAKNLMSVSLRTWAACLVALGGVATIGLDGKEEILTGENMDAPLIFSSFTEISLGDCYVIAAALAYTFHCLRLEGFAQSTSAIKLAASKAIAETTYSVLAVATFLTIGATMSNGFLHDMEVEISTFTSNLMEGLADGSLTFSKLMPAIVAIFWTGWITCAYTIYAQSYGQRRVRPITANLIYTAQPICTALFAYTLLDESLGLYGYLGGALIGAAVLLVTTADDDE